MGSLLSCTNTLAITPSEIQTKILILWLQRIVLGIYRYPLDLKDLKKCLEAQKRLGESRIRTPDTSKTNIYVVKSVIFKPIFFLTTWEYVNGTCI